MENKFIKESHTPNILQQVIDSPAGLIIFSLDKNYCYTTFSKSHKETMKLIWGAEINLGDNMLDFILKEEDKEKAKLNFDRALKGEEFVVEEEYGDNEHRTFWEDHYSPIFDDANNVVGLSVFVINITKRKTLELKLREDEELIRTTFYSIGDAVISTDAEGKVVRMNKLAEELTGWSEKEAKSESLSKIFNIIDAISRQPVKDPVEKVFRNKRIVGLANHTILISKNGTEYQIADSAAPIYSDSGEIIGVVLVFRDVTEKYAMENELKLKQELNESILNAMPDLLFVINSDYKFVFYNVPNERKDLLYIEPEFFIGKKVDDVLPPELAKLTIENVNVVLKTGKSVKYEYSLSVRKVKSYYRAKLVRKGEDEVLAVITDITEEKKTEQELRVRDEKIRRIFDSAPYPMHIVNNKFEILLTNKFLLDYKNLNEEEVVGKHCYEIYQDNDSVCDNCAVKKAIETKMPQSVVAKITNDKGEEKYFETFVYPIREEDGEIVEIVESTIDISERVRANIKLKENEERLETLINSTPDIVCFKDGEGRWLEANKADLELFALENVDYSGKTDAELAEFTDPIYKESFLDCMKSDEVAWQKGSLSIVEETIPLIGGGEKIFEVIKVPLFNEDGSRKGLVVLGRDITERKNAENKLAESENNFRRLTETATSAIFVFSKDKFLYVNKATERFTGYTSEELLGMNFWDVVAPEFREFVKQRGQQRVEGNEVPSHYEFKIIRKSGEVVWLDFAATKITWNGENSALGTAIDITKRKEAELLLANNEKKYRLISHLTSDFIFESEFDNKGNVRIVWVSDTFSKITGYSLSELNKIGGWHAIVHPNDKWIDIEAQNSIKSNRTHFAELRIIKRDGKVVWVSVKGEPIWDESKQRVVKAIGAVSDITERKNMIDELIDARHKAEASNRIKSEFLAQISHEIRSPLNVVLNFVSLLKMELADSLDDDLVVAFASIDSSSRRIYRTIDLILNMTELQSGTYESVKTRIEVVSKIRNIYREYIQAAKVKNLKISFNSDFEKFELTTDEYALIQIIVNLVDNAVKYTKEGEVSISISGKKNDFLEVVIADTGIGIAKDYLPEIFDAFSQEEQGYKRKFEGNGLGMALVKNYTNLIDGKISVESEKGKGTTMTVRIPDLSS